MKKLFFALAILFSFNAYSALKITGALTTKDSVDIGDGTTYVRIIYCYEQNGAITAWLSLWKNKAGYNKGKEPFATSGQSLIAQLRSSYVIDSATIAASPISGFSGLSGKSLMDKQLYWVHERIREMMLADNPNWTIEVEDIKL